MKRFWNCLCITGLAALLVLSMSGCFSGGDDAANGSSAAGGDASETQSTTAPTAGAPDDSAAYPPVGYVNATTLHIRPSPNTSGDPIGGLKFGDQVKIVGREGDWYIIPFKDGTAYISAQYVQETPPVGTTDSTTSTSAETTTTTSSVAAS